MFIVVVILIIPIVIFNDVVFGKYKGWNYNYTLFKTVFQFAYFLMGIRSQRMDVYAHDASKKYVFIFYIGFNLL